MPIMLFKRRAQLVAHNREEAALGLVGGFGLSLGDGEAADQIDGIAGRHRQRQIHARRDPGPYLPNGVVKSTAVKPMTLSNAVPSNVRTPKRKPKPKTIQR